MFADRTNWNLSENRLSQALARHRAAGRTLLDLTISNPTACGFAYDGEAILRALANPGALAYEPNPRGFEGARRAVAGYYAARSEPDGAHQGGVPIENIFLTTSTSEAYAFIFRLLCNPGDEVLVPAPSYPLFDFLAEIEDVKLARYPLVYDRGWRIDFAALQHAVTPRTRAVIVVHPNNPTGQYCKPEEAARLGEMCAARGMALITDEVFLDFAFDGKARESFAAAAGAALTFTLSGLSKISGLPQMKLAWLVTRGPEQLQAQALARLEVIADTFLSMNAPVQLAAPVLLGQRDPFQKQLLARARKNLAELDGQLAARKSCTRLEAEGGWYAVLRVPATRSDEDLAIDLLERKDVSVHPGHFYDFPADGYLVVSLLTPEAIFAVGISRLLSLFS